MARSMTTHQRGARCRVGTARRKHLALGRAHVSVKHAGLVRAAGVTHERDLAIYHEGNFSSPDKTNAKPWTEDGLWMDAEIALVINELHLWCVTIESSFDAARMTSADRSMCIGYMEMVGLIRKFNASAGMRKAFIALNGIWRSKPIITAQQNETTAERGARLLIYREAVGGIRDLCANWVD